ncbi:MAG: PDZ domain-containing protein [Alphaproteobacteria bacterium]|nr:PDZ domain-containing protein [Alphaproteobacteria bacterium]
MHHPMTIRVEPFSVPRPSRDLARLGVALLAAQILAACAALTPAKDTASVRAFPDASAQRVFTEGYRHIQERYVDAVAVSSLTLAGLERLETLAPETRVRRSADKIVLQHAGQTIGEFPAPANEDPAAWARLTTMVAGETKAKVSQVRDVPIETIYSTVFDGVLKQLDGYSRYTTARQAEDARAARDGFGGIGINLRAEDNRILVGKVLPETPAERAGIQANDEIIAIDGADVVGNPIPDVVSKLRGQSGTRVTIALRRHNAAATIEVSLTRGHITPQSIHVTRDGTVAHVRVSAFNRHTGQRLVEAMEQLNADRRDRPRGIILDLRGNAGGLLDQAVAVADVFLNEGIIVSTLGRHPASNSTFSASRGDVSGGLPLVVLINGRSASASEAVAAALQDWGRAVLVGTTSHGKGSVQNVARLANGGEMIVTWSRMHAPSGYVLDKLGVVPNVCTSVAEQSGDPVARLYAGRVATAVFEAWHDYDTIDEAVARTLRLNCPARNEEPEADVEIARRLLGDSNLYGMTLRPWPGAPALSAQRRAEGTGAARSSGAAAPPSTSVGAPRAHSATGQQTISPDLTPRRAAE